MKKCNALHLILLLMVILGVYSPAHATITFVKKAQNVADTTSTVTATFSGGNTAGCTILVTGAAYLLNEYDSGSPWLQTPTDTAGDTFVLVHQYWGYHTILSNAATWKTSAPCVGGANAVTVTSARGNAEMQVVATEYSGTNITVDQQGAWVCGTTDNAGNTGVISSPALYTSTANELLYAWAFNNRSVATLSVDNSYTLRASSGTVDLQGVLAVADRSVSSTGIYSTTFSGLTNFTDAGGLSLSEGGSVTTPAIEQVSCGDSIQAWHELGVFSGQDVILNTQKAGDYIFVNYRNNGINGTPTITNNNGYTWHVIQTSPKYVLWYAVVPTDQVAGDIISFANIDNDNSSRVVEIHGLSGLPASVSTSGNSASMTLTLNGYTTPAYCATRGDASCTSASQWYGTMLDTRSVLRDFLVFAQSDGDWQFGTIPGVTPPPGTVGTDLFPSDLDFTEAWKPGAPVGTRHKSIVY